MDWRPGNWLARPRNPVSVVRRLVTTRKVVRTPQSVLEAVAECPPTVTEVVASDRVRKSVQKMGLCLRMGWRWAGIVMRLLVC